MQQCWQDSRVEHFVNSARHDRVGSVDGLQVPLGGDGGHQDLVAHGAAHHEAAAPLDILECPEFLTIRQESNEKGRF